MPETPSRDISPQPKPAAEASASPISPRQIAWPILLSLAVLAVITYFTFDLAGFRRIIGEMHPWLMAAALGSVVLRVVSGGWRLSYISRGRLDTNHGIRGQLAWDFFSNVTPSAIGGGPFAAVYIARDRNIRVGESTAILLFAMLLDQIWFAFTIPVVLAASFFMEVIPRSFGSVGLVAFTLYFAGMLAWVVVFGYATMFRPDLLQRLTDWIFRFRWLRRFRERVAREMHQLQRRAHILRSQPAEFYVKGLLLTVVTWLSRYALVLFIVWSLFDDFDKVLLVLRGVAMMLGSVILPTPGGSGGIEALYALFIGPMIPAAALAPTLLLYRVLGYYVFVGIGVFITTHHVHKTLRRKRRAAREAQSSRPDGDGADDAVLEASRTDAGP